MSDPNMEKRNIVESGRTPDMTKQADADDFEQRAVAAFDGMAEPAPEAKPGAKHD